MQTIISNPIRRRIEQRRYLLGRDDGGEQVGEEGGVVAAAGLEEEFAGGSALVRDQCWGGYVEEEDVEAKEGYAIWQERGTYLIAHSFVRTGQDFLEALCQR